MMWYALGIVGVLLVAANLGFAGLIVWLYLREWYRTGRTLALHVWMMALGDVLLLIGAGLYLYGIVLGLITYRGVVEHVATGCLIGKLVLGLSGQYGLTRHRSMREVTVAASRTAKLEGRP